MDWPRCRECRTELILTITEVHGRLWYCGVCDEWKDQPFTDLGIIGATAGESEADKDSILGDEEKP